MTGDGLIEKWVAEYEKDPEFVAEGLASETIEEVLRHLKGDKSQTWLAEVMGVHKQQVSRWLNAPTNLTLLSIARMAVALDLKPRVILDSQAHFIRRLADDPTLEEFRTDSALASQRPSFASQDHAYLNLRKGAMTSGTAA